MKPLPKSTGLNLNILFLIAVIGITNIDAFSLGFKQNQFPDSIGNIIYDQNIHTVLLRSTTWEFSPPVIVLNSSDQLELRFDDLSGKTRSFGYTLIHCDANWKTSSLSEQEYLSGFGKGNIRNVNHSLNTTYSYAHYLLVLPEEDCKPTISGNFGLIVYDEDNADEIILTRRLCVTENSVQIEGGVKQPSYGISKETGQQVSFTVYYDQNVIRDPVNDVDALILQNDRYDNKIVLKKPFTIQSGQIAYNDPDVGIFSGGNEFRSLDLKSMKYQTENVAQIKFEYPGYHVYMKNDERRSVKPYFSKTDLNGTFYVDREKADNKHIEADYVLVDFKLTLPMLYAAEEVYVTGGFCDWSLCAKNLMKFSDEQGSFELTLLLKQGLYDYCFAMRDRETGLFNEYEIEGSFYETENDYSLFIYYHDHHLGYDRLLGYLPLK